MSARSSHIHFIEILSSIGVFIFLGIYFYATTRYPGGSQAATDTVGFDWVNNYWCNLMNEKAMNGQQNPARPYAIAGMVILCFSLALFFIQFAKKITTTLFLKRVIPLFGGIAMLLAVFIFTKYHDLLTIISSAFGVIAVLGILWEVYKSKMIIFKIGGLVCILLLVLNNYIYYSNYWIKLLPLIQKITFVCVLTWIVGLNYKMMKINATS
ncbi:hypothetical protein GCM10011344_37200 [Dokdonia pacifica]|uniref:DUF998 domain-containing protein n=1 Tax=Dokdonia pacifica TaxID=1627892 RepID=A0A239B2L7_9FLAO|nr:hypothetical protein [Dokdonia pacifica]GGG32818.1 hypothetical protein GCM10011344_37200 [Dokdonia pacifica]SNS01488.1 hypothetical protein SAMN06265376_105267 [Dokdonia pacifica]